MTETTAVRYQLASKGGKGRILDELCQYRVASQSCRKALKAASGPKVVTPRERPVKYGPEVIAALTVCWTVLGMPAGKRLAPMLAELVAVLRHFRELDIDEGTAELLVSMSAATIDRRLAGERANSGRGRGYETGIAAQKSDPGAYLGRMAGRPAGIRRDRLGLARWRHPGRRSCLDLDGHRHRHRLTENRSMPERTGKCVKAALDDIARAMPFPILGVDCDNGSEFINDDLLTWCENRKITFTRSRPGNKNDGCHVEQKNWSVVRMLVGYYRYDTAAEVLLLNEIWRLQSTLTNFFYPQQKLVSKVRNGAKVCKKHDEAATPFHRAIDHSDMTVERIVAMTRAYSLINPAATGRQVQALTAQLFTLATTKASATAQPQINKRARLREATNASTRAS
nr:transposase family protein [Mycolicibacterium mageritense]